MSHPAEQTSHRGVRWRRDSAGRVSFYNQSSDRWVHWETGVDAPPLPPKWQLLGVPTKVTRPGWRSPWRVVPLLLVVGAVVVAIFQIVVPSGDNTAKEAKASAALLGHCLPKSGGHFSSHPVPCSSSKAAVKVVSVIPSTPDSPPCPSDTQAVELAYPGVRYPHIECVRPATPGG